MNAQTFWPYQLSCPWSTKVHRVRHSLCSQYKSCISSYVQPLLNSNAHRHNFDLSTFWFLCSRDTTVLWTVLAPRWRCTIMAFICGSIDYNERHDDTIGTLDVLQACDACAGMGKTYAVIVQCADCVVFPNEQLQAFNVSCMRHEQHIHQLIWTQSRQMNATYTEIA